MHLKFTILAHFGTYFTAGKPKILLKIKVFGKTASLGVSNNISPKSQKNHRFLAKLHFWTQIYKLPHGAASKGYQKFSHSHIAYKRTIHLCPVSASLLVSNLPRRNSNVFVVQDHIGLKFWPQIVLTVLHMPLKGFWKTRIFTESC